MGISGNEKADLGAKNGAVSGIDTQLSVPRQDFFAKWKSEMFEDLYDRSRKISLSEINPKGNKYFNLFFNPSNRHPWFYKSPLARKAIVSLNRLRANHTSLAESLYRKDISDSPFCSCSIIEQTAEHVFWQCPNHEDTRAVLISELVELGYNGPFFLDQLLHEMSPNVCLALSVFISNIDIKI